MNTIRKICLSAMFLVMAAVCHAYDAYIGGIYYYLNDTDKTASVTHSPRLGEHYSGTVVIPESITYKGKEFSVTGISEDAFNGCRSLLTSITIPNSVTSIGDRAFRNCTGLTSIEIPNGVTSIGAYAFCDCTGLTSIEIPNGVTSIGAYAFCDCTGLTSIEIPNCVTSIGDYAFSGCTGLTSVEIPNGVTSIGAYAFSGCTGLALITIPNSVTFIGVAAFAGTPFYDSFPDGVVYINNVCYAYKGSMPSDTKIHIKEGTQSIVSKCFKGFGNLASITIPSSVTYIDVNAFNGCSGLKDLTIENGDTPLEVKCNTSKNDGINLTESTTKGLFYDCPLQTLYLGRNLLYDTSSSDGGISPFRENKTLSSVTIGNKKTNIEVYLFTDCSGLKELIIEDGDTPFEIENNAFYNYVLFRNCPLQTVYLGRNLSLNAQYRMSPFEDINSPVVFTIGNSVTSIGDYTFCNCTGLTSIIIPNSVTSIGDYAFDGCTGMTSVEIPNGVASIGNYAFYNCTGLTSIIIPCSVASIGGSAFSDCTGLTSVEISNGVASIGGGAFSNCTGLTSGQ